MPDLQPGSGGRGVVLVVDDAQENIDVLVGVLSPAHRVKAALSGARALTIAERSPAPDLILLDIELPDINGYEVCERLQRDPSTKAIPVIFITGRGAVHDKLRGFECGAVDYVTKPFEAGEVRARVETHLELRRARETIRRYSEDLEALLERRTRELVRSERQAAFGQLVQGIVHNLRNPLATVVMSLDELRELKEGAGDMLIDDRRQELRALGHGMNAALRIATTASRRISHMLDALMAKSRSDQTRAPAVVDLNTLVKNEIDFLQADPRFKHGTEKQLDLWTSPILVEVVPGEVAQVFQNLVRNALDAMHESPTKRLRIATRIDGAMSRVEVTDSGPGIPSFIRERVFEPFFTTKPAEPGEQEGSAAPTGNGLGLWMCREAVAAAGGEIGFDTQVDEGTTFWVRLPLRRRGDRS